LTFTSSKTYMPEIMDDSLVSADSMEEDLLSVTRIALLDDAKKQGYEALLRVKAIEVCSAHGVNFYCMHPVSRSALTHYRCTACGVLPLYCIDTRFLNKVRCHICGRRVRLNNSGKHGKLRKIIAISLRTSLSQSCGTRA
jgi:hypothetical protein